MVTLRKPTAPRLLKYDEGGVNGANSSALVAESFVVHTAPAMVLVVVAQLSIATHEPAAWSVDSGKKKVERKGAAAPSPGVSVVCPACKGGEEWGTCCQKSFRCAIFLIQQR